MQPLLSIVTVSLNAVRTIGDTLASVARQKVEFAIEHICVDGGSRDGTRDVIDGWAQSHAWIVRLYEPDTGIFDAMNKGLRAARGEYVLFLNADDFLTSPTTLATALRGVSGGSPDNPDLIAGHVSMGRLGSNGVWRHRRVPRLLGRIPGLFPTHQGQLAKRDLLVQLGGFDAGMRLASDVTLYYDLERRFRPKVRRLDLDVAFMRAGGAANSGLHAVWLGSLEIYLHLVPTHGRVRAAAMAGVKTLQSCLELRYGKCPHERWFAT